MSFLAKEFEYNGKNSSTDFDLTICSFDDNLLTDNDTFLAMESIYSDTISSAYRNDFGARYTEVLLPSCSIIHSDGSEFTREQKRSILKWLAGSRELKWLRIIGYDYVSPSGSLEGESDETTNDVSNILCRVTSIYEKKAGDKTVGFTINWTGNSPYSFSDIIEIEKNISGSSEFEIDNAGDEEFDSVYPVLVFEASSSGSFSIVNETDSNRTTEIEDISSGETIRIDNLNQIISTDGDYRVLGDSFNKTWFRLLPGENIVSASGTGTLTIQYRLPLKVGEF